MSILTLLVILIILGVVGWFVNYKLPISGTFKMIISIVLIIIAIWLCLDAFGILSQIKSTKVPSL